MATTTKTKARTVKPAIVKAGDGSVRVRMVPAADAATVKTAGKAPSRTAKQAKAAPATGSRKKAAAPAPASAKPAEGVRERIWKLMQRKTGTTEREVCAELGWKKAGATISRAIKAAPFKVAKTKDESGRTRYVAGAK